MATTIVKRDMKSCIARGNANLSPKKISKIGEFWRKYPKGVGLILDHKAALK